uniref:DMAP1-binding domain-containing protein n=1 Tax=Macrostomum lignano TaxID=282301 RepID=A0A1I8IVH7_9PLAT
DITQKGYKKKRARLLDPYIAKKQQQGPAASASGEGGSGASAASPAVRDQAGGGGRRDDIRYHSEIRAEAVQAALARNREASAAGPAGVTTGAPPAAPPAPSGRRVQQSSGTAAAVRLASDGDSTDDALDDDDDDDGEEDDDVDISEEAENNAGNGGAAFTLDAGSSSADGSLPSAQQQQQQPPQQSSPARTQQQQQQQSSTGAYVIRGNAYLGMPTNDSRHIGMDSGGGGSGGNASMSTLRRVDDAVGQQRSKKQQQQQQQTSTPGPPPQLWRIRSSAKSTDASAPKPQGEESLPVVGEPAALPPPSHASIEEALARAASSKSTAVSTMEPGGRLSSGLTYAKLYSRSRKLAHHLLNRLGHRGDLSLKPGDRVALAYPGHDPSGFAVGFLACQLAGLVAVPVEPPPLCVSATGFLLSSLEVRVLLTNDSFFRAVTKGGHEPPTYPGWPPGLLWSTAGGGDSSSNLATPPKDWQAPALAPGGIDPANLACIEYAYGRDGSVRGVCITRAALLAHTAALCSTLGYSNGETMLCLLDAKRELGLWHGLLAAICSGVHTIHVPYNVMKAEPLSWLRLLSKLRASLALAKSRDLYWSLLGCWQRFSASSQDHSDINLASLRCLIVSDGANPWSLTSCDSFVAAFKSARPSLGGDVPVRLFIESLTVSLRDSGGATGRGVLSMLGLSHGVVRVDSEASYTSLTLQDCGQVRPGSDGGAGGGRNASYSDAQLCRCCGKARLARVCAVRTKSAKSASAHGTLGRRYWGLAGLSNQVFRCQLTTEACEGPCRMRMPSCGPACWAFWDLRIGLCARSVLGFGIVRLGGGLVFVCGSAEGLIVVSGRRHNSDDLIATVLAVEPLKFVHRGRIAVFSQELLRDERVIVVAEQRPDATEEQSFQWMSHVLQAVDSIHQVGVYCIALAPPNSLPRSPQGGVCPRETRRRYLANQLHPCSVLLCPHSTVTNLPRPRELPNPAHGPMSALLGSLVQGGRPAFAEGRPVPPSASPDDAAAAASLAEALRWRVAASASADNGGGMHQQHQQQQSGFSPETAGAAPAALMKRAEKLANALRSRVHRDAVVAIALPPGLDLAAAVFACQLAACVPLPVRPPAAASGLNTCRLIIESGRATLLLTTQPVAKLMRSKDAMALGCSWPPIVDVDDARRRHSSSAPPPPPPSTESGAAANNSVNGSANDVAESTAYLDYSVSTTGLLTGVRFTQRAAVALCRSLKLQCELYPAREVALCLDPYSGSASCCGALAA